MDDVTSMALCAIRYCIGRQSYIVSDGQRWALEWGEKSPHVRSVIMQDLKILIDRCDREDPGSQFHWLGASEDERGWREVYAKLAAVTRAGGAA